MNSTDIKREFLEEIRKINKLEELKNLRARFLGKSSKITILLREVATMSAEEKREAGSELNTLKNFIAEEIEKFEKQLENKELERELQSEILDVTLPVREREAGFIHPLSKVQDEFRNIMYSLGFSLATGSEIENDWNCFEGLNIPKHHPARQMQDTFYLRKGEEGKEDLLLRTQTTAIETREMTRNKPPFKFFCCGKTFRSEMDSTHCPMFHQLEGVYVDEHISMQDLKDCLATIMKKFFDVKRVPLRFRPSYFPFTSPSVEVDIQYKKVDNRILVGEGDRWIEVLGAGMLHENVFKNVGVDIAKYQGFAFGFGIERMAMLKYAMGDMRNLYDGDVRFLRHYGFRIFE